MTVRDFTLMDMIERNAQVFPEREALVYESSRMTFAGYLELCRRLCGGLQTAGARSGDRIALIAQNSLEYMLLYGAAALGGFIIVPINWRLSAEERHFILLDASPAFLVVSPDFHDMALTAETGLPSVKSRYVVGRETRGDYLPLEGLYDSGEWRGEEVDATASYALIYTAAVDGRPKGAELSQGNIVALNTALGHHFKLDSHDAHPCFLPLFHIAGLSLSMAVMQAGGKNVIQEKFDADRTLDLIERERVTVMYSFPPMLDHLVDGQGKKKRDLASLKWVGGLNPPESIERFQRVAQHTRFSVMFGQTEAMGVTIGWFDEEPGSAGRSAPLARVRIVDEADNEVAAGTVGEICVKSPCVFSGYWGLKDDTARTLRNGWHHTGDMGRMDERGYLFYAGRIPAKELIKTGGENVYPAEVEKVLLEHPSVAEACVIGVPDDRWGEAVKAVCVLHPGLSQNEEDLAAFVASRLAGFKKPRHVVYVEYLPKTDDGVIDRTAVKKEHV